MAATPHPEFIMDPKMSMGSIALRVGDLNATREFYTEELGLRVAREDGNITDLAPVNSSEILVILIHDPEATPPSHNSAGLYHFAMLLPSRAQLARAYLALGNSGLTIDGYADHLVSEALYLTDPEGNGIEIYADKPRRDWRVDEDGAPHMGTHPLDIDSLLLEVKEKTIDEAKAISKGTVIGHVHLKVTEIRRSTDFYHYRLGLDLMNYWDTAAFVSAGGYHHHIGMNTWESAFGPKFQEGRLGLEYFTIHIPNASLAEGLRLRLGGTRLDDFTFQDPDGVKFKIKGT